MEQFEALITRNVPFLLGGAIIGVAASGFLWLNGRIAGISGIVGGLLGPKCNGINWRIAFLLGLLSGGAITFSIAPNTLGLPPENRPLWLLLIGGLLVGLGTGLAQGCTSGHGICGLARRSPRSLVATLTFMVAGMLTATCYAWFWG